MTESREASPESSIERSLATLQATFRGRFEAAASEQPLRDENAKVLGKKGELTAILKQMGAVPAEARKAIGELVNALKQEVEAAFEERLRALAREKRTAELGAPALRPVAPRAHPRAARSRAPRVDRARRDRRRPGESRLCRARRARGRGRGLQLHQARFPAGPPRDGHARQLLGGQRRRARSSSDAHEQRADPRDDQPPSADGLHRAGHVLPPRRRRDPLADVSSGGVLPRRRARDDGAHEGRPRGVRRALLRCGHADTPASELFPVRRARCRGRRRLPFLQTPGRDARRAAACASAPAGSRSSGAG